MWQPFGLTQPDLGTQNNPLRATTLEFRGISPTSVTLEDSKGWSISSSRTSRWGRSTPSYLEGTMGCLAFAQVLTVSRAPIGFGPVFLLSIFFPLYHCFLPPSIFPFLFLPPSFPLFFLSLPSLPSFLLSDKISGSPGWLRIRYVAEDTSALSAGLQMSTCLARLPSPGN